MKREGGGKEEREGGGKEREGGWKEEREGGEGRRERNIANSCTHNNGTLSLLIS